MMKRTTRRERAFTDRLLVRVSRWLATLEQRAQQLHNQALLSRMGSCGQGTNLYGRARITGVEHVRLGGNVHIGDNVFIRGEGELTIGDNTHISRNLVLYTINHRYEGDRLPYDQTMVKKPVVIGRNVWIGMNVCITPGTTIGDGAIVAMGTVVSGDVPPLTIIGGSAWRELGRRDEARYKALDEAQAFGGPNGRPL